MDDLVNKSHLDIWVGSPLLQWVPHFVSARSIQRGALEHGGWMEPVMSLEGGK